MWEVHCPLLPENTFQWLLTMRLMLIIYRYYRLVLTLFIRVLWLPSSVIMLHFRTNQKSDKLAVGRKKFNMDPKKVRTSLFINNTEQVFL